MRIKSVLLFFGLALSAHPGSATPLAATAAVQSAPDAGAPIITYLKAGTEPVLAPDATVAPPGWIAVQLSGPFEGYVRQADLTKSLDVKPGAPIRLEPKPDAGVLAVAQKGDKTDITGIYGKWTKVRLSKPLTGFVQIAPPSAAPAAAPVFPAETASPQAAPATEAGRPVSAEVAAGTETLPRFFEGQFLSTRRPLAPRRPYDWELDDFSGARIAYLDVSRLLLTEQIDKYVGHDVSVYGALRAVPGYSGVVIAVESLRLR